MANDGPRRVGAKAGVIDAGRKRAGVALPDWLNERAAGLGRLVWQRVLSEVAPGRLIPWLAVAFGAGIVLYFTAGREPAWWAGL